MKKRFLSAALAGAIALSCFTTVFADVTPVGTDFGTRGDGISINVITGAQQLLWEGAVLQSNGASENAFVTEDYGLGGKAPDDRSAVMKRTASGGSPFILFGGVGDKTADITVEASILVKQLPDDGTIRINDRTIGNNTPASILLRIDKEGNVDAVQTDGSRPKVGKIKTNEWHRVAVSYHFSDSGVVDTIYFDGKVVGSSSGAAKAFSQFRIFDAVANTSEYAIDDFKVYGGAYSGTAVADISTESDALMLKQGSVYMKESMDVNALKASLEYDGELKIFSDSSMKAELSSAEAVTDGSVIVNVSADGAVFKYYSVHTDMTYEKTDFGTSGDGRDIGIAAEAKAIWTAPTLYAADVSAVSYITEGYGLGGKNADDRSVVMIKSGKSSSYLNYGEFNGKKEDITIEGSILVTKLPDGDNIRILDRSRGTGSDAIIMTIDKDGNVAAMQTNGARRIVAKTQENEWHRFAVSYTFTDVGMTDTIYWDGEQVGSVTKADANFIQFRIVNAASTATEYAIDDFKVSYGAYAKDDYASIEAGADCIIHQDSIVYLNGAAAAEFKSGIKTDGSIKLYKDASLKEELADDESIETGNVLVSISPNGQRFRYYKIQTDKNISRSQFSENNTEKIISDGVVDGESGIKGVHISEDNYVIGSMGLGAKGEDDRSITFVKTAAADAGGNQYLDYSAMSGRNADFTIEGSVLINELPDEGTINFQERSLNEYVLQITKDGRVVSGLNTAGRIRENEWHRFALRYDFGDEGGLSVACYWDGEKVNVFSDESVNSFIAFRIHNAATNTAAFSIDDFRVYYGGYENSSQFKYVTSDMFLIDENSGEIYVEGSIWVSDFLEGVSEGRLYTDFSLKQEVGDMLADVEDGNVLVTVSDDGLLFKYYLIDVYNRGIFTCVNGAETTALAEGTVGAKAYLEIPDGEKASLVTAFYKGGAMIGCAKTEAAGNGGIIKIACDLGKFTAEDIEGMTVKAFVWYENQKPVEANAVME